MAAPTICVPGQKIYRLDDNYVPGNGTDVRNGFIYSCLAGCVKLREKEGKTVVDVITDVHSNVVPTENSIITAKVTNVNPRFCKCAIVGVEDIMLKDHFRGLLRREDVRATEKDKVEMYKCFHPGDVILARVTSLGDSHSYILSTAENELGVVLATSEAGVNMIPKSWCEMQCPKTHNIEFRKVAKVQPKYLQYAGAGAQTD